MPDDASQGSLNEQSGLLEAILREFRANSARLDRLERRVENATEAEAILRRATGSAPPLPRPPAHKRPNPAGLHIVRGIAAAGGGLLAWMVRSRLHKATTLALMAVAGTATAVTPSVIDDSPAQAGPSPAVVRHHHRAPAAAPQVLPPAHKRHAHGSAPAPAASAEGGTATPAPEDEPQPSPLQLPPPSVSPLCVKLADKACDKNPQCVCAPDGDGDADDVLALSV